MFNNLFNKNKYDVKPENNNPQRVYGVPNRYDQKAKYDIKPERNEPRLVYGPPEVMLKLIEEEEKKNGKELFSAFQSEYAGPSHYYYVNKFQGKYQFRYGYTDNGAYVDNKIDNPALKIVEQDEDYYNSFMKELLPIIKDWNDSYMNTSIPNGTEWQIYSEGVSIHGLNDFPENFDNAISIIKRYFDVNNNYINKYDIDPHDNIPEDLYGIPDFLKYQDDEDQ